ncbi:MAG: hypothetical protein KF796_08900 [Ramlibacter sp.]|nr:hypothetical protein [Ramlibacter sp.]
MVRAARLLAGLCVAAALAWPALTLWALAGLSPADLLERAGLAGPFMAEWGDAAYTREQQAAVLALLTLPVGLSGWALLCLARGFHALAGPAADLRQAQAALRRFAGWTVVATAGSVLAGTLASVLLTWHYPPGQRQLAVALSSAHFQALLVAGLVWVFAHLLVRAQAVAEENAQFV